MNAIADVALELPEAARAPYIDEACAGDTELRREVAALLAAHSNHDGFLEVPLLELLAKEMSPPQVVARDLTGKQIGRYELRSRLGAGGVGEVWLADDRELPRKVAIKMLSPRLRGDADQLRRFQQEARAASLLNHPNIITIYDIGKWEGEDYIAEEFVQGETVRERLSKGRIETGEALTIAAQVAAALAAAHEAGIVHRDIKPENIMLRPDGLVKILDFGLARFVEHSAPVRDDAHSRPGFVLGTARYMSPEQVRGLPLDGLSDLFSLGAVLYEMLAATPPFAGETSTDVLAAILHDEPRPLRELLPGIAPELEAVVGRCLSKDAGERYPASARLQQDLRSIAARFASGWQTTTGYAGAQFGAESLRVVRSRLSGRWKFWAALSGIAAAASLLLLLWHGRRGEPALDRMTISRLETRGESSDAAISRDGKDVAYVLRTEAGESIWKAQLEGGSDVQAVAPEPGEHVGIKFSPDGAWLYYRRNSAGGEHDLYRVSARGGAPIKVLSDVPGSIAVSPDGRRLAFIRIDPDAATASVMTANADGSAVRTVRTKRRPEYYSRNGVAWSPDGSAIACFTGNATGFNARAFRLVAVNAAEGSESAISEQAWAWVDSVAWAANFIVVSGSRERQDMFQIWLVTPESGGATRVTNDLSSYRRITVSADGRTLEALQIRREAELWIASAGAPERTTRIALQNVHGMNGLAWIADGRLAFTASGGERRAIWITDAAGANQRQISGGPADKQELNVTRNGRYFLFSSRGTIWRMDLDGTNPVQLTHQAWSVHPASSADSRFVYYVSFRNWSPAIWGKPTLWRVPIEGGQPVETIADAVSFPEVSPDGSRIAGTYYPGPNPEYSASPLAIFSAANGRLLRIFHNVSHGAGAAAWTPDGRSLIYPVRRRHVDNLWRVSLADGVQIPLTKFQTEDLFQFAFSADFKSIAMARGREATDVVLIGGFR